MDSEVYACWLALVAVEVEETLVGAGGVGAVRCRGSSRTAPTEHGVEGGAPRVLLVVISVGADNDFGHPCAGVLERLAARAEPSRSVPVYRADEQGVIEVITDGAQIRVDTER